MTVVCEMLGLAHCWGEEMVVGALVSSYQGPKDWWGFIHHADRVQCQTFPDESHHASHSLIVCYGLNVCVSPKLPC